MNWILFFLFLHITGAVIAFGPTFTFPIIGSLAQKNPMHANFAFQLSEKIEHGLVIPLAMFQFVTGVGLLVSAQIDLVKTPYLVVAILLYLTAMAISLRVLVPTTAKLEHMTSLAPAPGPGAMTAPPPELLSLTARLRTGGMITTVLFFVIIFLMIVKPGGIVNGPLFGF